jgi:hypothetical protein
MSITTLLKINGTTVPNVKEYKPLRAKLWGNAERTMSGELQADFVGVFPKIQVTFAPMGASDLATIIGMLDEPFFTLTWHDAKTGSLKSAQYYASDYDTPLLDKDKELYNDFSVSLVPVKKYS